MAVRITSGPDSVTEMRMHVRFCITPIKALPTASTKRQSDQMVDGENAKFMHTHRTSEIVLSLPVRSL